jgi:hypothetical protein
VRVGLIALGTNMALNVGVVLPSKFFGFPYPHPRDVDLRLGGGEYRVAVARPGAPASTRRGLAGAC